MHNASNNLYPPISTSENPHANNFFTKQSVPHTGVLEMQSICQRRSVARSPGLGPGFCFSIGVDDRLSSFFVSLRGPATSHMMDRVMVHDSSLRTIWHHRSIVTMPSDAHDSTTHRKPTPWAIGKLTRVTYVQG